MATNSSYKSYASVTSNSLIFCVICQNSGKMIQRPCGHYLCKDCWRVRRKDVEFYLCPIDYKEVSRSWMDRLKDKDFLEVNIPSGSNLSSSSYIPLEKTSQRQTTYGTEFKPSIRCPKCKNLSQSCYPATSMGSCKACDFVFCTSCGKDFHGGLDCAADQLLEDLDKDNSKVHNEVEGPSSPKCDSGLKWPLVNSKITPVEDSRVAKQFEIDFYTPDAESAVPENFSGDDITKAFLDPTDFLPSRGKWPWDTVTPRELNSCPPKFQSLRPRHWVEDELLENSIKVMIHMRGFQEHVAFLESFLMNWSLRKNIEDNGELLKVLHEKELSTKEMIISLVNTEFGGIGGHWILCTIHLPTKTVLIQDSSLVLTASYYRKVFFLLLHILHLALKDFRTEEWRLVVSLDAVQQTNSYDCGPLAVCNAFGVMNKLQVDVLPKGDCVREWLLRILTKFEDDLKEAPQEDTRGISFVTPKVFNPTGLKIHYEFFRNKNLFRFRP